VTEYLFRKEDLLDEVLDIAIDDNSFRSDDLEFTFAARVGDLLFSVQDVFIHLTLKFIMCRLGPIAFRTEILRPTENDLRRYRNTFLRDSLRLSGWGTR
jgi:hypothetical protein